MLRHVLLLLLISSPALAQPPPDSEEAMGDETGWLSRWVSDGAEAQEVGRLQTSGVERNRRRRDLVRVGRSSRRNVIGASLLATASPRLDDDEVRGFYGGGIAIMVGRYVRHWLRVEGMVMATSIGRDEWTDRKHGIETSAGLALTLQGASFPRGGLGLGIDVVRAREAIPDQAARATWWGVRFRWIHELAFFTTGGIFGGIQITPTWTWVPYLGRFKPGVVLGFNLGFGG